MPPSQRRSTPPADAPPVTDAPAEPAPAVEHDAAPLTPPADPDPASAQAPEAEELPDTVSDAAPLTPPEPPTAPVPLDGPTPVPPPSASLDATPDVLEVCFEDGTPAHPGEMFDDPGPNATYVTARRRLRTKHYALGATTPHFRLLYAAGAVVAKTEADRIRSRMAPSGVE